MFGFFCLVDCFPRGINACQSTVAEYFGMTFLCILGRNFTTIFLELFLILLEFWLSLIKACFFFGKDRQVLLKRTFSQSITVIYVSSCDLKLLIYFSLICRNN